MGTQLRLAVSEPGSDQDRLEELALQLRGELLTLDVGAVDATPGGLAPEGTRSGWLAAAGVLLVSVQPTLQAMGPVLALARDWLHRPGPQRTVRVEIDGDVLELTGASSAVQERLVEDWLTRHAAG
jgi:hypothetical protein